LSGPIDTCVVGMVCESAVSSFFETFCVEALLTPFDAGALTLDVFEFAAATLLLDRTGVVVGALTDFLITSDWFTVLTELA
jgi:hypothetical protein